MSPGHAALIEEAVISQAFAEIARAERGEERAFVRTYVADELVLTVTEHERRDGRSADRIPDRETHERRAMVEQVKGRPVAATLHGRLDAPEVTFELFVLEPETG